MKNKFKKNTIESKEKETNLQNNIIPLQPESKKLTFPIDSGLRPAFPIVDVELFDENNKQKLLEQRQYLKLSENKKNLLVETYLKKEKIITTPITNLDISKSKILEIINPQKLKRYLLDFELDNLVAPLGGKVRQNSSNLSENREDVATSSRFSRARERRDSSFSSEKVKNFSVATIKSNIYSILTKYLGSTVGLIFEDIWKIHDMTSLQVTNISKNEICFENTINKKYKDDKDLIKFTENIKRIIGNMYSQLTIKIFLKKYAYEFSKDSDESVRLSYRILIKIKNLEKN